MGIDSAYAHTIFLATILAPIPDYTSFCDDESCNRDSFSGAFPFEGLHNT